MRISFNLRRVDGPYGGASQFVANLEEHLTKKGHEVFRHLPDGLDAIVIVSSQTYPLSTAYTIDAIGNYTFRQPNTLVVHRINTCDEQRGNDLGINRAVFRANRLADHTVFVSKFIEDLYRAQGLDPAGASSVILNGANDDIFHPRGRSEWKEGAKLRLVTHHWSSNYLKGFDIYERLDALLGEAPHNDLFEFSVIGSVPLGVRFCHARVEEHQTTTTLADILRQHHLYVTAARNEPGGNHPIEAMRCGLPVLYLRSGSLPEYCGTFGLEFTLVDFEARLLEARQRFPELRRAVLNCPFGAEDMATQWEGLLTRLVGERQANPCPAPRLGARLLRGFGNGKRRAQAWRRHWDRVWQE